MGPTDMRLERRLKRRCIANQSFNINKRTSQNAPTKVIVLDEGKPGSPDNLRPVTKRENMENPEISKDVPAGKMRTLIDKNLGPDLSEKASSRGLSSSEPKCKRETEPLDNGMDKSYKTFLECVKEDGNCLVFVNQQGKRVKYEAEEESESD